MTYCVGMRLASGLVMLSDTRTNAGVDNISTFQKQFVWENPGERVLCLMTAGNLAATQAVTTLLTEGFSSDLTGRTETLWSVPRMFTAAQLVGEAVRRVWRTDGDALRAQGVGFDLSLMLGGQIGEGQLRLYQIYSAGNFIEATEDTPYLQIGEHKYGKPILDRACRYDTPVEDAVKLALVSMDSTLRSNLTVGLPIDLLVARTGAMRVAVRRRLAEDDPYLRLIREQWGSALREAYRAIPRPEWV